MNAWANTTLGDICAKITDGAHNSPKSVTDGKSMASVKDMTPFGVDLSDARQISLEDFDQLVRQGCQPKVGDVLIAKDGNSALDAVCVIKEPLDAVLLSSVAILRPDDNKVDAEFLKYYFTSKSVIHYLKTNFISGAAIPRVVLRDFGKAEISLPPLNEQRKISTVLNSVDQKIELNQKQNRTLEAIAHALFKRWFMDFEFPDENGRPYKSSGGAMRSSELGEIPVGWSVGRLEALIGELETGVRPKGGVGMYTEGVPSIGAESITRIGEFNYSKTKFVPQEYFDKMRRGLIKDRDVLIYKDGGTPGRFDVRISMFGGGFPFKTACINEHVFRLRAKKPLYQNYLYLWFSSYLILEELRFRGAKAAIPGINQGDVKELDFLFMDELVLEKFDQAIEPLFAKILLNSREAASLSKLRDTLLPKLMSGELRVA